MRTERICRIEADGAQTPMALIPAAMEEECAYLKAENAELLAALRAIRDYGRAPQPPLPDDAAQHWELRAIARDVIDRVCGGSGISAIRTTGIPGRDPEFPCADFKPGEPYGRCEGDGHYLCDQCTFRVVDL